MTCHAYASRAQANAARQMACAVTEAPRPLTTSCVKRSARVAFGAVALAMAGGSHGAGLFLPVDSSDALVDGAYVAKSQRQKTPVLPNAWERHVRIARHKLAVARDDVESGGAGRLLLNVKDGVRLNVVVERTAPTKWGYSLSGRVAGGGVGFVTLVVHEDVVAGSVWTPGRSWELLPLGRRDVHALRDTTKPSRIRCVGASPWGSPAHDKRRPGAIKRYAEPSPRPTSGRGNADDGSVVDILVVWGTSTPESLALPHVDLLIAYTNDAFERSGAFVSLNLVGAERVAYPDSGPVGLSELAAPDDGKMDAVHSRRDILGADLVHLVRWGGTDFGISGVAQLLGPFSVADYDPALFAHEIGHNFGILHERYEFEGTLGTLGYQHGFSTGEEQETGCDNTLMSYGLLCPAARAPFYASPWLYSAIDGRALGMDRFSKVRGVRGAADAVLTLNRNRHTVANFRPSRKVE